VAPTGVLGHTQVIEYHAYVARKLSHFLWDTAHTFRLNDTNCEATQAGNVFRTIALAYPTAIFVKGPINDVVAGVFDTPVTAICGEHTLRIGLFRSPTGNTVGNITRVFTALFVCGLTLDEKGLSDMGKIQITIEFGCGPDASDFNAAVFRWIKENKVGILAVLEV
jgi:hypothetical protein